MLRRVEIGHAWTSDGALLAHARTLTGRTAGELARLVGIDLSRPSERGRTGVGDIAERYFGRLPSSSPEPDIVELSVEIKTIPLKPAQKGWTVKEPTSLTQIDPQAVLAQPWANAYVRRKLAHILWIPYEHHPDLEDARFRRPFLWKPSALDEALFARDYEVVRQLLQTTPLGDISESLCHVMGARRKDKKGGKKRAWALKARFTRPLIAKHALDHGVTPVSPHLGSPGDPDTLEALVEQRLGRFVGRRLDEVCAATGARIVGGKSGPAAFVRALLGASGRGPIEEFEKLGIRIHSVWADPDTFELHEDVSFPRMSLVEFAKEEWPDAELVEHIDRILFLPLLSRTRERERRALGRPFFWSPTPLDMGIIKGEWHRFQRHVRNGDAKYEVATDSLGRQVMRSDGRPRRWSRLPGRTDTTRIHMRPHARDADDEDVDPKGNRVTFQSFWLNRGFVKDILLANAPLPPERRAP